MRRLSARPGAAGPFALSSQGFSLNKGPAAEPAAESARVSQAEKMVSITAEGSSNCSNCPGLGRRLPQPRPHEQWLEQERQHHLLRPVPGETFPTTLSSFLL